MRSGSGLLSDRRSYRLLLLIALAIVLAVAVPTAVFGANGPDRSDPPKYSGTPNSLQSDEWAAAPAWAAALQEASPAAAPGAEVIVEFARGTKSGAMLQTAGLAGATLKWSRPGNASKAIPIAVYKSANLTNAQLVSRLKNQPGVVAVSVNNRLKLTDNAGSAAEQLRMAMEGGTPWPSDPSFGSQWALENTGQMAGTVDADIDAKTAWQLSVGSGNVVVAVIDSGVDYSHPDLCGNLWTNPGEELRPDDGVDNDGNGWVDDLYGVDVINSDGDPWDDSGHGTHVAGIIGAMGGNGLGTTGVAWETKIMALKAFDANGSGTEAGVIACINYAIEMKSQGVNIVAINASFEGDNYNQALRDAIQAAGEVGIVFVAAAGNTGRNIDSTATYPAAYDCANIIAVGASNTYDARASFSNYGSTRVDVFAPGTEIISTIPDYPSDLSLPETDLFYDDMESGPGNWVATGTWAITQESYNSSSHAWSDSPGGIYANNSRSTLTSRTINLGGLACTGRWLGFALAYQIETNYDALVVRVSGNNGTSWESLGYFTGTGEGYFWAELPEWVVTSTFKVQFVLESDPYYGFDGVYLDDVCVTIPKQTTSMSGTSMAAPHVAGTVALLASAVPEDAMGMRIQRILETVDKPAALDGLCATDGRLNAGRALTSTTPAPTITELYPDGGVAVGGTAVDVYGTSFWGVELAGAGGVTFGGVNATSYTVKSSEHIVAVAPAGTGGTTVQVQVHAAGGDTADTEADDFTYMLPPTVTGVSPSSGPGTGGITVTITGTGLEEVKYVTFGGVKAKEWWSESPGMLKAVAPVHTAGTVKVNVTTYGGTNVDDSYNTFTYVAATAVQQSDPRIAFLGGWGTVASPYASGGSLIYGATADCQFTVTFEGNYLALVARMGPDLGKAWVTVDGYEDGYVDFYSETSRYQQVVYSTGMIDSGAHTVTFRWAEIHNERSSGYAINADVIQVLGTVTQAPVPGQHQQNDVNLGYTGEWSGVWSRWASGGSFRWVNSPGASVNVKFTGSYCAWIAKKGPGYGKAWVSLDGGGPVLVDLYSSYDKFKQRVYSTGLLEDGEHSLSVYWIGQKNSRATACRINIDMFEVLGEVADAGDADPIDWQYEQSDGRITYLGPWTGSSTGYASGGSYRYTLAKGAGALVNFTGDSVALLAKTGPTYGEALVTLDGSYSETVSLYSETYSFKQVVFSKEGLEYGPHTLSIKALGPSESSPGSALSIDALRITGCLSAAPVPTRFQQDEAAVVLEGTWTKAWSSAASGGSFKYAGAEGAALTVTFEGTYLAWIAKTSPWYGKALVTLDGGEATYADLWSATSKFKQAVYSTGLLEPGRHTLTIRYTGIKHTGGAAAQIGVDAFDVLGTLVTETL